MNLKKHISSLTSIAPLAVFRVLFGFIMAVSIARFAYKGWIYEQYIKPEYYFSYLGFEWVQPLGDPGMYILFLFMGASALGIMLGKYFRVSSIIFFLTFTYVELIDKTNYLNHYYFVSIISFLLIFLPAHRKFSLDALKYPAIKVEKVPAWTINILKLQLGIVYFYAGAAKINPDWLLHALPLRIWLPANGHLPFIGWILEYDITAYLFSWAGALYDLTIVFFLLYRSTRVPAYITVIVFHLLTFALFQIGMFPFIMIVSTLIYFSAEFHEFLISKAKKIWRRLTSNRENYYDIPFPNNGRRLTYPKTANSLLGGILIVHFVLQLLVPLRFSLYPGNLFWTEQGYRFSWRVMLMEKAGHVTFKVTDNESGRKWEVSNYDHLTPVQEKMMSTQPDMILQFAHYLEDYYKNKGIRDLSIRAETHVTLNGRRGAPLVNSQTDLTTIQQGLAHKDWILPYPANQKSWIGHL